jgi:hypothetical protein
VPIADIAAAGPFRPDHWNSISGQSQERAIRFLNKLSGKYSERNRAFYSFFRGLMEMNIVLTGLLLWFGNGNEPVRTTLTSSQTVGIPKFKPEPEDVCFGAFLCEATQLRQQLQVDVPRGLSVLL